LETVEARNVKFGTPIDVKSEVVITQPWICLIEIRHGDTFGHC